MKNKVVWYFHYNRGFKGRINVNVRRSADAEMVMRNGVKNLIGAKTSPLILYNEDENQINNDWDGLL